MNWYRFKSKKNECGGELTYIYCTDCCILPRRYDTACSLMITAVHEIKIVESYTIMMELKCDMNDLYHLFQKCNLLVSVVCMYVCVCVCVYIFTNATPASVI